MKKRVLIMISVGIGLAILIWFTTCPYKLSDRPIRNCETNASMILTLFEFYLSTHDNKFPSSLQELCSSKKAWQCPAREKHDPEGDYVYLVGGLPKDKIPIDMIILYEKKDEHQRKGRLVLYSNFGYEWLDEEEFQKKLREQKSLIEELKKGTKQEQK